MLRCGLRVEEVARLTADAIEYRRRQLYVFNGKGSKDRVVYLSEDAFERLQAYMHKRRRSKEKRVFLVQKGDRWEASDIGFAEYKRESNIMRRRPRYKYPVINWDTRWQHTLF